jgi:hypothetical protein
MGKRRESHHHLGRRLHHESLESRCLLAGLVGSPWQNPLTPIDLDADGEVSPLDAALAINALNGGLGGALAGRFAPPALHGHVAGAAAEFLDADGDGHLSAIDPALVINALNSRGLGNLLHGDVPAGDPQPDEIDPEVAELVLTDGRARVLARLDPAGDVDVFRIVPTKGQLSVVLFVPRGTEMTVAIVDASGAELDSAGTADAGSRRLARVQAEVEAGDDYFIVVSGDEDTTGIYGLQVLNFDAREFKPKTDAELGDDIHGDLATTDETNPEHATPLELDHRHARVSSNIDTAEEGDSAGDRDVFSVEAGDGKLILLAGAEFDLKLEVLDADGEVVGSKTFTDRRPLIVDTTAGTYFIAVSAANGTSTGAYRLHVVDAGLRPRGDDGPVDPSDPSSDPAVPRAVQQLFARIAGDDGAVSLDEIKAAAPIVLKFRAVEELFAQWDTDSDGGLTLDELSAGLATLRPGRPHDPPPGDERRPLLRRLFG